MYSGTSDIVLLSQKRKFILLMSQVLLSGWRSMLVCLYCLCQNSRANPRLVCKLSTAQKLKEGELSPEIMAYRSLGRQDTVVLLLVLPLAQWPALGSLQHVSLRAADVPQGACWVCGKDSHSQLFFKTAGFLFGFIVMLQTFFSWKLLFPNSNLNIPQRACPFWAKILRFCQVKTMEGRVETATLLHLRQGSAPLFSGELLKYILARIWAKIFSVNIFKI